MTATAVLFLASALIAAFASNLTVFVFARLVGGLAVGAAILIAPVYIAEIAPADRRGALVSLNQLMMVVGISASFFSNYLLLGTGEHNWRWMLGVQAVPAAVYLLLLQFVPESPRWLLAKGRDGEARRALERVAGGSQVDAELRRMQSGPGFDPGSSRWRGLASPRMRFVMRLALVLAFFQQITGINAVFYYLPTIFARAGGAHGRRVPAGDPGGARQRRDDLRRDRADRPLRPQAAARRRRRRHGRLAPDDQLGVPSGGRGRQPRLVLLALIGFVASFAMSLGPVTWVLLSEIFPNENRAVAVSVVAFWNSLVSAGVTLLFPWQLSTIGPGRDVPRLRPVRHRRADRRAAVRARNARPNARGARTASSSNRTRHPGADARPRPRPASAYTAPMALHGAAGLSKDTGKAVRQQLDRMLASPTFQQVDRLKRFLNFIVTETVAGRGDQLKEYVVGVQVFDKETSFDPRTDPIVRVQARRLRARLARYYRSEGQTDETIIDLPKGGYLPVFRRREAGGTARRFISAAQASGNSVAVVPFSDHSPGGDLAYVCKGVRQEIIHGLARVAALRVVAWDAAD